MSTFAIDVQRKSVAPFAVSVLISLLNRDDRIGYSLNIYRHQNNLILGETGKSDLAQNRESIMG